jgi:DNA-binding CsgD family transcriptional regulator|tara:strand:- start:421 stop:591 length:171 start_codon:yes stop_codon:yes gene_type:complete
MYKAVDRNKRLKEILDMRARGMTFKQIGEELQISRQRVHFILNNNNKSVDSLETIA